MRHRSETIGHIFLAEKEGAPAFTDEDEEVLVETSPVGVVVFDAQTGRPASFNREARRIVDGLRTGDGAPHPRHGARSPERLRQSARYLPRWRRQTRKSRRHFRIQGG